jgi:type IV pilus assembly protein PilA
MAQRKQRGFSLVELLVVVAIILIITAIAVPNLLTSRMRASESSAVQALRTLNNSQMAYSNLYGPQNGYAPNLHALGPGTPCDNTHACMVDELLGCTPEPCVKGGYNFFMATDSTSLPITDFVFTATPQAWQRTGAKNFCTVDDGTLRFQVDATASLTAAVLHDDCLKLTVYEGI